MYTRQTCYLFVCATIDRYTIRASLSRNSRTNNSCFSINKRLTLPLSRTTNKTDIFPENFSVHYVECFFGTGRGPVDGPAVFLDPCQIDYLGPSIFKKLFKKLFLSHLLNVPCDGGFKVVSKPEVIKISNSYKELTDESFKTSKWDSSKYHLGGQTFLFGSQSVTFFHTLGSLPSKSLSFSLSLCKNAMTSANRRVNSSWPAEAKIKNGRLPRHSIFICSPSTFHSNTIGPLFLSNPPESLSLNNPKKTLYFRKTSLYVPFLSVNSIKSYTFLCFSPLSSIPRSGDVLTKLSKYSEMHITALVCALCHKYMYTPSYSTCPAQDADVPNIVPKHMILVCVKAIYECPRCYKKQQLLYMHYSEDLTLILRSFHSGTTRINPQDELLDYNICFRLIELCYDRARTTIHKPLSGSISIDSHRYLFHCDDQYKLYLYHGKLIASYRNNINVAKELKIARQLTSFLHYGTRTCILRIFAFICSYYEPRNLPCNCDGNSYYVIAVHTEAKNDKLSSVKKVRGAPPPFWGNFSQPKFRTSFSTGGYQACGLNNDSDSMSTLHKLTCDNERQHDFYDFLSLILHRCRAMPDVVLLQPSHDYLSRPGAACHNNVYYCTISMDDSDSTAPCIMYFKLSTTLATCLLALLLLFVYSPFSVTKEHSEDKNAYTLIRRVLPIQNVKSMNGLSKFRSQFGVPQSIQRFLATVPIFAANPLKSFHSETTILAP